MAVKEKVGADERLQIRRAAWLGTVLPALVSLAVLLILTAAKPSAATL